MTSIYSLAYAIDNLKASPEMIQEPGDGGVGR